jgi:hypothetical protein
MKLLFTSLAIAFASSTLSAAAPAVSGPAQALPPASTAAPSIQKVELARRFVGAALPADRYIQMVRDSSIIVAAAQMEEIEDAGRKAEAQKDLDHYLALIEPKIREHLPNLLEAYAQAYAREYSADELQQMIAFAGSPAGQHYLSRRLAVESDPSVQAASQALGEAIAPVAEQIMKEKCAERTAKRIAAGDKKAKCALSSEPETQAS